MTSIDLVEIPGNWLLPTSLIRALTQHGQSGGQCATVIARGDVQPDLGGAPRAGV
jgi:hypothetical protein